VCFYCTRFSFFSTIPRDWLERTSPKWPILCRVGHKTLAQSIDLHFVWWFFCDRWSTNGRWWTHRYNGSLGCWPVLINKCSLCTFILLADHGNGLVYPVGCASVCLWHCRVETKRVNGSSFVLDGSPNPPIERETSPDEVGCWTWDKKWDAEEWKSHSTSKDYIMWRWLSMVSQVNLFTSTPRSASLAVTEHCFYD